MRFSSIVIGASLIIAALLNASLSRYDSHTADNAIWVVDRVSGDVKACTVSFCNQIK